MPFSFGEEEVNLDETVTATCTIIKGDLPIRTWWRFSESDESMAYNLTTGDGIVITKPSQKVSLLTIEAVKARHRGNYSCYAANKGGATSHSAYLAVNGTKLRNFFFENSKFCNLSPLNFIDIEKYFLNFKLNF